MKTKIILSIIMLITIAFSPTGIVTANDPHIEDLQCILIDNENAYDLLDIDTSKIADKRIYVEQALTVWHLPFIVQFNASESFTLSKGQVSNLITHDIIDRHGIYKDISFEYNILVNETYSYEQPVYVLVNHSEYDNVNTTWYNWTENVLDHYEVLQDYHYVWMNTKNLLGYVFKQQDFYVLDIVARTTASIQYFGVDIAPTIYLLDYTTTLYDWAWWNTDWSYYRLLTINPVFIDDTLTNFPVLVNVSAAISAKCDSGNSIRFLNVDNATEYYYEIEGIWNDASYNFVWVNITSVSSTVDTRFLMYYNNTDATDNQNPTDVWDENFIAVYHMNSTTDVLWDSTENRHGTKDGATDPVETDGVIGKAQDFEVDNEEKIVADKIGAVLDMTVECWYTPESDGTTQKFVENTYIAAESQLGFLFQRDANKKIRFNVHKTGGNMGSLVSGNTLENDDYAYVVGVLDDEDFMTLYLNTVLEGTDDSITGDMTDHASAELRIGADQITDGVYRQWSDGVIDEVRISKTPRSLAWIRATYNSSKQTATFMTWGSEQDAPTPPIQSDEVPVDDSRGISITPTLNVTVDDKDDDTLDVYWLSNSTASTTTYTITEANDNIAWYVGLNCGTDTPLVPEHGDYTEYSSLSYSRIGSDDGVHNYWGGSASNNCWYNLWHNFTIDGDVEDIDSIKVLWNGYDELAEGDDFEFDIWNYTSGSWQVINTTEVPGSEDVDYGTTFTSNFDDFIVNGSLHLGISGEWSEFASCPYVYVWNGADYYFDSEAITRHVLPEWTGSQLSRLPSLKPIIKDDEVVYKLKITEELPEKSYIDNVELIKVYHNSNDVYSGLGQNLWTTENKIKPMSAIDDTGKDVFYLIEYNDNIYWNDGDYSGTNYEDLDGDNIADSNNPDDLYKHIELTFEKPSNVDSIKLNFKAVELEQETFIWANMLRIMDEKGITSQLATDGTIANWFGIAPAMFYIQIWNGINWNTQTIVQEFASHKGVEVVYKFDISDIETEDIKIRFYGMPNEGGLDYVYADYSEDSELRTEIIPLTKATFKGNNITDIVGDIDNNFQMLKRGDEIFFEFADDEVSEDVTYFLNVTGYYKATPKNTVDISDDEFWCILNDPLATAKILAYRFKNNLIHHTLYEDYVEVGIAYVGWTQFALNLSVDTSDGAVNIIQTNSNFSAYGTTYWWSVNITDGTYWTNETYTFTTETGLMIISEYPINESIIFSVQPTLCFNLSSTIESMGYKIYVGITNDNVNTLLTSVSGVDNGRYHYVNYYDAFNYSTTYYWRIHYNDTMYHKNVTFSFQPVVAAAGGGIGGRVTMGIIGVIGILGLLGCFFHGRKKER